MKKILLVLFCCFFCMPVWTNAQTNMAYIFGASDASLTNTTLNGNSVSIKNEGNNTKIYLGLQVVEGSFTTYEATLKLSDSNYSYRSYELASGWSGTITEDANESGKYYISLKRSDALAVGKYLVVTIYLNVAPNTSSDHCTIELSTTKVEKPVCEVVDGKYYDNNGNEVSYPEYLKACTTEKYYCEEKNGYFFDKNGNSVSESEYRKSCFSCAVDGDKYYDNNGNEVSYSEYLKACTTEKYYCEEKNGYFFDKNGNSVSESEYRKSCFSCMVDGDKYYDKDGQLVDKDAYESSCMSGSLACTEHDGKYYDMDSNEITKEEYENICYSKVESYQCLTEEKIEYYVTRTHVLTGDEVNSVEIVGLDNPFFQEILSRNPNVLDACRVPVNPGDNNNTPGEGEVENPQTGMDTSYYILIPIGIGIAVFLFMKSRKSYLYKL